MSNAMRPYLLNTSLRRHGIGEWCCSLSARLTHNASPLRVAGGGYGPMQHLLVSAIAGVWGLES